MVWVATEVFSVGTEICRPCVAIEIQCCDKVWAWVRLGSQQGSPCVATGFPRVVLRQRVLGWRTIGLGTCMSTCTSGGAAPATELTAHTVHATDLSSS